MSLEATHTTIYFPTPRTSRMADNDRNDAPPIGHEEGNKNRGPCTLPPTCRTRALTRTGITQDRDL